MSWFGWLRRSPQGRSRHKGNPGDSDVVEGLPVALVGGRQRTRGIPS